MAFRNNFHMITQFLVSLGTLFAIVDPITLVGPFLAMTPMESDQARRKIAIRAVIISTIILVLCALLGETLLKVFGITLPAFQIAGGALLFLVAFDMIYARPQRTKRTSEEEVESIEKEDVAVFPLAIPLLAGPGAIVSIFILMNNAATVLDQTLVFAAILVTMLSSLAVLFSAKAIERFFGKIGMNTFSRLMGIILASISVQFILDGIKNVFPS